MDFFRQLFTSGGFQPHGYCYHWNSALVWLNVLSDALIALAYFTIPFTLLWFIRKRRDLPFSWMFVLFGLFIIACGSTHVLEVWNLWHAQYWLAGVVKAITAGASVPTAILLVRLMPQALQLPSVSQWMGATAALEKEVQERKREEKKFRSLLESAPDAMVIVSRTDQIQLVNTQVEKLFGYGREELVGKPVEILVPQRFHSRHEAHRTNDSTSASPRALGAEVDLVGRRKDGTEFPIEITLSPIETPEGTLVCSAIRDVTERKRVAEALKASEERLQTIVEAAQLGVWDLDLINDRAFRSLRHDQIFGFESLQPEWGVEIALTHIVPEDRQHFQSSLAAALETGGFFLECRIHRAADHALRWISAQGRVYRDFAGKPVRMMGVLADITDRKQAEQDLVCQQQELARANSELAVANNELESFSYSVSHDLRAPLRTIDGFSHALLEDYADRLDDAGKTHLHRIRAATQRMGMLIDDLLNLSRLSRAEMRRHTLDISALASSVASDLQKAEPERHIELRIEDGLTATADPGLLRAVIENLLSNAWKFSSKRASALIEFGATCKDGTPAYFVRDNGAGFDPAYADRLFGAFQRLHSVTEFPGTGVGLATVQRIVHRHGGHIWAESAVDRGATFYFTLSSAAF